MESKEPINYLLREKKTERFDQRLITDVVRQIESGVPRKEIMFRYGMTSLTLSNWMSRYGSDEYRLCRRVSYKASAKRSILRAIEQGMSVREAIVAFNMGSSSVIYKWIKEAKAENAELSAPITMKKSENAPPQEQATKALELRLAEAELKVRALETMIDIAEEQLKIDIRKKSGAKQSPK